MKELLKAVKKIKGSKLTATEIRDLEEAFWVDCDISLLTTDEKSQIDSLDDNIRQALELCVNSILCPLYEDDLFKKDFVLVVKKIMKFHSEYEVSKGKIIGIYKYLFKN